MEALSALALAGNTVQFIDFASKLCGTSIEIYRNAHGASASRAQSESLLKSFIATIDDVTSNLGRYCLALSATSEQANSKGETQISYITSDCRVMAQDLLQRYNKLKLAGKPGKWQSFTTGVKCMWKKHELDELEARLERNRNELEWHILLSLR